MVMSALAAEPVDFAPYFKGQEVIGPSDESLMREALELRYQVYCMERAYLDTVAYPSGIESDDYDVHAAHFVALNQQDELAGYVRLVRPDAIETFPFQNHCVSLLDGMGLPPASQSAEISRLIVAQHYRRRRGDQLSGVTLTDEQSLSERERRVSSPQILLCVYRQMYQYSIRHDIRYWYAAMERYLARALACMHFRFQQIGPYTDYYGPVALFVADLRQLEAELSQSSPLLLAWLQGSD